MAKDLTVSAIAEARQIKEAAMAQAKLTIQETFQPTLQRMISSKLREEEEDEFDDAVDIDIEVPSEEPVEEVPEEGGEDIGMGSFEDEEEAPVEGEGDDLELEALIRELGGMEGEEEDPMLEMDDEFDPTMEEGEEESWQDPIEEEDCSTDEDMLETLIREIMDGEEESLDENEDGGGAFEDKAPIKQMNHESRQLRSQNAKLRKDLNEALQAITTYKRTINEVNLLNAKLLYTTKALRVEGLTQPQQVRILESFDRAGTVREVKLVYTTILESLNKKAKVQPKKKVQEGLASKPIKAVNPKQTLNENDSVVRWQQLAGLKSIKY